ncbi:MAG: hypothetical protein K6T83_01930 [Alicyclobacillus sp.]|nr:hypothetical protein [Alicyclobacillus sp.]
MSKANGADDSAKPITLAQNEPIRTPDYCQSGSKAADSHPITANLAAKRPIRTRLLPSWQQSGRFTPDYCQVGSKAADSPPITANLAQNQPPRRSIRARLRVPDLRY